MPHRRLAALTLAAASIACSREAARPSPDSARASRVSIAPAPAPPAADSDARWTITPEGLAAAPAGTRLADVAAALGVPAPTPGDSVGCAYVTPRGAPPGLVLMVIDGRVARVDVRQRNAATAAGARVGDEEARVVALYQGRVTTTAHKYVAGGHYLTVTPANAADSAYRIVFETDGQRITQLRAGHRPEVAWVEGCG